MLFVSLVGCIIPRIGVYAKALPHPAAAHAAPPVAGCRPTPAARLATDAGRRVLERAASELRRQRYRVRIADGSVSAERGYLREAGNLVFHVSLLFLLLGVALGGLFGFRGTSVVVVGQGFANTITQYDDLTSGGRFSRQPAQAVRRIRTGLPGALRVG